MGAPIGQIAWGGKHEGKLPRNLRIGSVVSIGIFIIISLAVIDTAGLAEIFANSQFSINNKYNGCSGSWGPSRLGIEHPNVQVIY